MIVTNSMLLVVSCNYRIPSDVDEDSRCFMLVSAKVQDSIAAPDASAGSWRDRVHGYLAICRRVEPAYSRMQLSYCQGLRVTCRYGNEVLSIRVVL